MTNLNRKKALAKGELFYQGKPCVNGHSGIRYVKNHNCPECSKAYYKPTGKIGKEPLVERIEALKNNELFYFTGKPCKRGHISRRYVNGHECEQCKKDDSKNNKQQIKLNQIKRNFGLSQIDYENLLKSQKYNCAICKNKLTLDKHTHIDHCHETNRVRGILCHWCNLGIGHLKHNPELLRAAALYCEEA